MTAQPNAHVRFRRAIERRALWLAEVMDLTIDDLRDFLDEHWGESAAATRRQRLAALKSFYAFCVEERGLEHNPIEKVKPPKRTDVARNAYTPDIIDQLREAQPTIRDQIAVQLLGRLGLRKNELRLIQIGDFDLIHGDVQVHAKGGHIHKEPLAYSTLTSDIEVHIVGRGVKEYLLYPKLNVTQPMTSYGIHLWFKRALKAAGLPETIKMHELRHSAADNLWPRPGTSCTPSSSCDTTRSAPLRPTFIRRWTISRLR